MAQPGQNSVGAGTYTAIALGGIFVMAAVLWHFKHDALCMISLKYSFWITWPFAKLAMLVGWESAPPVTLIKNIVRAGSAVPKMQPMDIFNVLNKSGFYTLPLLYFIGRIAWKSHTHPYNQLQTKFGAWSLIRAQSKKNPCIIPVVRFEESWRSAKKGRAAQLSHSEDPISWSKRHNLILDNGSEISLNIDGARKFIIAQLGPKLGDMKSIPDHYKALAVIFLTRINGRSKKSREEAQKMLDAINLSTDASGEKGGDFTRCFNFQSVAMKYDECMRYPSAKAVLSKHSFGVTFLMGLLYEARKDGKIPCSQFIWLKLLDRPLFYALHGVTPTNIARGFMEAAGPVAQFWAEMTAITYGQALHSMHIEMAIPALEQRLYDRGAITRTSECDNDDL